MVMQGVTADAVCPVGQASAQGSLWRCCCELPPAPPLEAAAAPGSRMDVAASLPVVSVPVLSKAAVPQCASASSTTVPVTRMPLQVQSSWYQASSASMVRALRASSCEGPGINLNFQIRSDCEGGRLLLVEGSHGSDVGEGSDDQRAGRGGGQHAHRPI